MAQANWTRKFDWGLTSLLCVVSGVMGVAIGLGLATWDNLANPSPTTDSALKNPISSEQQPLQPFFPGLGNAEAAVAQARVKAIVRREATRQQQLDQTREVLSFNGATTADIEAHVIRQLANEATTPAQASPSN